MKTTEKNKIAQDLQAYIAGKPSQKQAAASLLNVSQATLSHINSGKWNNISDNMWRTIAAQVTPAINWNVVETGAFTQLMNLLEDARKHHNVFAITGNAGCGKTLTMRHYTNQHRNVHLIHCNEFWNRKYFLLELMRVMGRDGSGLTVNELMAEAVRQLKMQDHPLIILDEGDKLSDQVLYFFISLYNALEDHCGIIIAATDHLEKRLKKGLRLNKKGYNEIYSRVGRKCIELNTTGITDITQVCLANGITAKADIKKVIDGSDNDLRRVKRQIHALRQKAAALSDENDPAKVLETLENVN